jgi:hypothetical protein
MIGWLVRKRLDAYERELGYDVGYLRDIYTTSPRAIWREHLVDGFEFRADQSAVD